MGVTKGKVMVSAEVSPELRDKLQRFSEIQGISQSESIRRILQLFFSFSDGLKEPLGKGKEGKDNEMQEMRS